MTTKILEDTSLCAGWLMGSVAGYMTYDQVSSLTTGDAGAGLSITAGLVVLLVAREGFARVTNAVQKQNGVGWDGEVLTTLIAGGLIIATENRNDVVRFAALTTGFVAASLLWGGIGWFAVETIAYGVGLSQDRAVPMLKAFAAVAAAGCAVAGFTGSVRHNITKVAYGDRSRFDPSILKDL